MPRMRHKKMLLSLSIAAILGVAAVWVCTGDENTDASNHSINTSEILHSLSKIPLKSGDLILRHGNGIWSNLIREKNFSDKRFSHIGILVKENGNLFVVHADCDAVGNGSVRKDYLEDFLKNTHRIGIFRLKTADADMAVKIATSFVGVAFDRKFKLNDSSELYCSELIYLAMKNTFPRFTPKTIELCGQKIIPVDALISAEYTVELFDSGAK